MPMPALRFLPISVLMSVALLGCAPSAGDGDDDDDDDDDDDSGEGEGEGGEGEGEDCAPPPGTDVGDRESPSAITPPACFDVALANDADVDCFIFPGPAGTVVQLVFDDATNPIDVDVFDGEFLDTGFTNTGHTVEASGSDITVCFEPEEGEAPLSARLNVRAPVNDNPATDDGGGTFTYPFDAPGDGDCARITVAGLSHVIVVGDGCDNDDELDIDFSNDATFDFGFFAGATGQSCGLALLSADDDGDLCITDHGATRLLGPLSFDVSFLADDHGSGSVAETPVTLPFTGTADIEIDSDTDCFAFTVAAVASIEFDVSGQASPDDVSVQMTWDDGDVFDVVSGIAPNVTGDVRFCVQGLQTGALAVSLSVAP